MKSKKDVALNSFKSGLNCAQSVLSSFTDEMEADLNTALRISAGFGAGMGRLQKTCGAVTGAFMVIGLVNSVRYSDQAQIKERNIKMIQQFNAEFVNHHKHTDCEALIKCDLKTDEGQSFFSEQRLSENVCEKCIASSVDILMKMLKN